MRTARLTALFTGLVVLVFVPFALAAPPQPVSPGDADVAVVEVRCPTFSWAPARDGALQELAVYSVSRDGEPAAEPVLSVRLPAGARTWTPSLDRCLERSGRYAWSLRELERGGDRTGPWSEPMLFEVAAAPTIEEVEAALDTLRRYRESVSSEAESEADPVLAPGSAAAGTARSPAADATGGTLAPKIGPGPAPTLDQASLTLSDHLVLAPGSGFFQDGTLLFWVDPPWGNMGLGDRALGDPGLSSSDNTGFGHQALREHESGPGNTAIGNGALILHVSGSGNTALGNQAMASPTGGSDNLALGAFAGNNLDGGSGNIMIDHDGVAGDADVIRIGYGQTETHIAGIHGASLGGSTVKRVCVDETDQVGPCPPTPPSSFQESADAGSGDPGAGEATREVLLDEIRALRLRLDEQQRRLEALERTTSASATDR
jgi:hypothetical protein